MDRSAKIIVVIVVIVASAFFIYSKLASWHANKLETTVKQEKKIWQEKSDQLQQEIEDLKQELAVVKGQSISQDKLSKIFGKAQTEDTVVTQQLGEKSSRGGKTA